MNMYSQLIGTENYMHIQYMFIKVGKNTEIHKYLDPIHKLEKENWVAGVVMNKNRNVSLNEHLSLFWGSPRVIIANQRLNAAPKGNNLWKV